MKYGDRIQWGHDGEVWPGRVTGIEPAGRANWLTITLDTDGLSYDVPESAVVRKRSRLQDFAVATAYDTAYEINDPKHPEFHSVHADLYDNREKV